MSKFESTLLGRKINSIPPGIIHGNNDLPDSGCIYQVHTIWADEAGPMVMAELINVDDAEDYLLEPDQVKVWVVQLGMTWNLLPEDDDES